MIYFAFISSNLSVVLLVIFTEFSTSGTLTIVLMSRDWWKARFKTPFYFRISTLWCSFMSSSAPLFVCPVNPSAVLIKITSNPYGSSHIMFFFLTTSISMAFGGARITFSTIKPYLSLKVLCEYSWVFSVSGVGLGPIRRLNLDPGALFSRQTKDLFINNHRIRSHLF